MPGPSETLPVLEQRLTEHLLAFELLDEAWSKGRTAIGGRYTAARSIAQGRPRNRRDIVPDLALGAALADPVVRGDAGV